MIKTLVLPFACLLSIAMVLLTIGNDWKALLSCIVNLALFTIPGQCLVFPLYYSRGRWLEGLIWGSVTGVVTSSLLLSLLVSRMGWNITWMFGSIIVVSVAGLFLLWKRGKRAAPIDGGDVKYLVMGVISIVSLFFFFPFRHLGILVNDKYIFSWLFGHDFINRMAHVASISATLPMQNLLFSGEGMNYYWLSYIYPAFIKNHFAYAFDTRQILMFTVYAYSVIAASAIVIFLGKHAKGRQSLLFALCLCFFAYSYSDLYLGFRSAWDHFSGQAPIRMFGYDLTKFSGVSHSFYRFFLVEPQGTLAVANVLFIFTILTTHIEDRKYYAYFVLGLTMGSLFGVEAAMGLIVFCFYVCTILFHYACWGRHQKEYATHIYKNLLTILTATSIYALLVLMGMYTMQTGKGIIQIRPNYLELTTWIIRLPIEYGPVFFLGSVGIFLFLRRRTREWHWGYSAVILLGISMSFSFLVVTPFEKQFGMLKAARFLPICFLLMSLYLLDEGEGRTTPRKWIIASVLLAIPTFFTDIVAASNINDHSGTFIRKADYDACAWIRNNLKTGSVIQAEPNYPGADGSLTPKYYFSLIPIFAERPTAVGEWKASSVAHGSIEDVSRRFHEIRKIYSGQPAEEDILTIRKYNIEYIYFGSLEKNLYPGAYDKFDGDKDRFDKIYESSEVSIFRWKS